MWNFNMYDSSEFRYNVILCRYLLTVLGLDLKFSDPVIEIDDGNFTGLKSPMVGL